MPRAPSHLLLLNGNTTAALTARLEDSASRFLGEDWKVSAVSALFGPAYISSRPQAAIAGHAVLATVEQEVARLPPIDGCLIACFGEPGITAVRDAHTFPVVGMAEASVLTALQVGRRFGIVTVGEHWPGMLEDYLRALCLHERCCAVLAVGGSALDFADDRNAATARIATAVRIAMERHGAEAVIIGGAALAGMAAELRPMFPIPLIDSFEAALAQASVLIRLRTRSPAAGVSSPVGPENVSACCFTIADRAQ